MTRMYNAEAGGPRLSRRDRLESLAQECEAFVQLARSPRPTLEWEQMVELRKARVHELSRAYMPNVGHGPRGVTARAVYTDGNG